MIPLSILSNLNSATSKPPREISTRSKKPVFVIMKILKTEFRVKPEVLPVSTRDPADAIFDIKGINLIPYLGTCTSLVPQTLCDKFQVRFARVRHHVTPALSYYYHSTQNLMHIKLYHTDFFRKFSAKSLCLQSTNSIFIFTINKFVPNFHRLFNLQQQFIVWEVLLSLISVVRV